MAGNVFILCLPFSASGMDCYIVHINCDIPSIDEVSEYGVHYSLEGGGGVGQAEEHDCGFEEPFVHDEGHLPSVFFLNKDFIVSPLNVHPCK